MDLLQLKYFKVVAEQEHITKSAKLLMVSQPYLSAIVARLEEEMGGQLFDRDGRNVVLNEYGKILLHHANGSPAASGGRQKGNRRHALARY